MLRAQLLVDEFLQDKLDGPQAFALLNKTSSFTSAERMLLIEELIERQVQRTLRQSQKAEDRGKGNDKSE